jgi:hypothetical protein
MILQEDPSGGSHMFQAEIQTSGANDRRPEAEMSLCMTRRQMGGKQHSQPQHRWRKVSYTPRPLYLRGKMLVVHRQALDILEQRKNMLSLSGIEGFHCRPTRSLVTILRHLPI